MTRPKFITAIGTPLTEDESLHEEGLRIELEDQWNHEMDGLLVAGTMGAMQLLTDETYRALIQQAVEVTAGRGEVLVGAGDAGFARTRDRIRFLNEQKIDGVAVLSPFFWKFGQEQLIAYFRALADESKFPVYLYDLPQLIDTRIELETVLELAKHPNIAGAKISGSFDWARKILDHTPADFRVVIAQPDLLDIALHHGAPEHLDGMWAIAPGWVKSIGQCAMNDEWEKAAEYQRDLTRLRDLLAKFGFDAFSTMMNARGIPGRFAPYPFIPLDDAQRDAVLSRPAVRKLIQDDPAMAG